MPSTPPSRSGPARRWLARLLVLTLALAGVAGVSGWWIARTAVPELDGELRVTGLLAPVEVLFDQWAVPHVYARDSDDAWFAAGYLQARERAWKMELYRRAASGRLSELFGEATLPADRRFLALGLRRAAKAEWDVAPPRVRRALERHAAGVNAAFTGLGRWRRPVELQLVGVMPEPWTPVDSLSIGKIMAWRLAENRHGELVRGALARAVGAAQAQQLMGGLPSWAPTILETGQLPAGSGEPPTSTDRALPPTIGGQAVGGTASAASLPPGLEWLATGARAGGSNSWVVAGTRTASGRPLLANDPHLAIEMPSIWYELHLVAADLDVAGATIPGVPFIVIGHNQRIAWGLTNTGADVIDFFVEEVDFKRRRYLHAGEWLPLRAEQTEIAVRGRASPEAFTVFSTRHGPLVATETEWEELPTFGDEYDRRAARPLAMRWETRGESAAGLELINRAGSWPAFVEGVRRLSLPSQNVVYADVDGNIGYAASGALPIRAQGTGSVPAPGWTGGYDWVGTHPPERLPTLLNPPAGQIVTANAEIDRAFPGGMTADWTSPYRTMRIVELLGSRTGLDQGAMRTIQADVRSVGSDRILTALEQAARGPALARAEAEARTAVERLRLWDRQVDGRPVAALYQAFERALWRRVFADELPAPVFTPFFEYGLGERYAGIHAIIDDPTARWWDDIATVDRRESRDDVLLLAAADAMLALRSKFGPESRWDWDRLHAAHFDHALAPGGMLFRWFFSRGPVPQRGDSATVNKSSVDVRRPFGVVEIASYRQVLDIGAWDRSLAVNTTGQSGHPSSPHYFDQNPLWARVEHRAFPFTRAAVEKARRSRLFLVPTGG